MVLASVTFVGPEYGSGEETKQVAPSPCPEWYADDEFNVDLWGTYLFYRAGLAIAALNPTAPGRRHQIRRTPTSLNNGLSWNVANRPDNNFGMVRGRINFAL